MTKQLKKVFVTLLAVLLVAGSFPMAAFAESGSSITPESETSSSLSESSAETSSTETSSSEAESSSSSEASSSSDSSASSSPESISDETESSTPSGGIAAVEDDYQPQMAPILRAGSNVITWKRLNIPRQSPGHTEPFKETPTDTRDYVHEPSQYVNKADYSGPTGYVSRIEIGNGGMSYVFANRGSTAANLAYLDGPDDSGNTTVKEYISSLVGISVEEVIYAVQYMNNTDWYMFRGYVNGELAYCIEPTVPSASGESHGEVDADLILTRKQQEVIGLIIYYAGQQGAATNDAVYCAAQMMIWEIANKALSYTTLENTGAFTAIYNGGVVGRWEAEYAAIKNAVINHKIIPSFLSTKNTSPLIDKMSYVIPNTYTDGILEGGSVILEDTNGVTDKMNWPTSDPNFIFEVLDSSHLKITSRGNVVRDWYSPGVITKQGFEGIQQMGTLIVGDGKGNRQDIARTKVLADPFGGYMRLRTNGDAGYEVTKNDAEGGWVVGGNTGAEVALTFPDGHTENVFLPIVVTTPGNYSMREIHTPLFDDEHLGYVLSDEVIYFTVASDDNWDTEGGGGAALLNKRQKGKIIIQKVDDDDAYINHINTFADDNTFTASEDITGTITAKPEIVNPLPQGDATFEGAEFTVKVHKTIYLANGDIATGTDENGITVQLVAGVIVDRVTTDASGRAESRNDLELGLYEVQETRLPNGYQYLGYEPSGQIYIVDNHYTDETVSINEWYLNYANSVIKGHLSIHKVLEGEVSNDVTKEGTSALKSPAEGVYFAVYLLSKEAANSAGVVVIGSDGVPRTVTDKTQLPDDYYVIAPLDGSAPPMQKGDDDKWYFVDENGDLTESAVNPTDLFDLGSDPSGTEDGYYKSLYMILRTDDQGNASSRNPDTIAWVTNDGITNIAPVDVPMPLPYGKYRVSELNAPEGYETVGWEFEVGYESFLTNPDAKGTTMTPETGYDAKGDVVQNGKFGKDHYFSIENKVIKQRISVYKRDNETEKLIPQAGVPFKIWTWYNTNGVYANKYDISDIGNTSMGEWVTQTSYYPTPTTTDVFVTNAEGWFALEEPLVYGDYAMVELSAPNGYWLPDLANTDVVNVPLDEDGNPQPWLWSTDPVTGEMVWYVDAYGNSYAPIANITPFTVSGSGEEYDATKPIIEVEVLVDVFNENQKGYLTLYKEGYVLTEGTTTTGKFGTETKPKWELGGLPNAEYQIYAKADIVTPEGTLRHSAGDLIQTLTTDSRGKLVSEPLYLGEYYVVESKAPYGYILDTTKYDLTLTYQGENVRIFPIAMERFDVRQNVVFKVLKQRENAGVGTGATDPNASSWTGANGVIFGLYARNDIMAVDGTTVAIPADALIEQISITNGEGVSGLELPLGKYYVKELETTADLKLDETEYDIEFKFTADDEVYNDEGEYLGMAGTGKGEVVIEIKLGEGVSLKNYLKRGSVEIRKADKDYPTEIYLAGAEFTLYDSSGTARAIIVTDMDGKGRADNLPYGQYVMRETKAPEGYKLSAETWIVNIDADGVVLTYDILDEIDNPQVKVYKKDTSGRSLGGATFEILRAGNADAYLAYKAAYADYLVDFAAYKTAYDNYLANGGTQPIEPAKPALVEAGWEIYTGADGSREYRYVTDATGGFTSGYLEDGLYKIVETKNPADYHGQFEQEFTIEAATMSRPRILTFSVVNFADAPGNRYGTVDFSYNGKTKGWPKTGDAEITQTEDIITDGEEPKQNSFPATYEENGVTYTLKEVTYAKGADITKTVPYNELHDKEVPDTILVEIDGVLQTLHLQSVDYKDTGKTVTVDYTHDFGYTTAKPRAAATRTITITDEATGEEREVEVNLVSVEQAEDYGWRTTQFSATFYGDAGVSGFTFGNEVIPYNATAPVVAGYESAILDYLGLDKNLYRVTGAKWTDADFVTVNGQSVRRAIVYAEVYAAKWVGIYSAEDTAGVEYSATAVYSLAEGGKVVYTATATYVATSGNTGVSTQQIILYAGIVLLAAAVIIVLIILAKKRKKKKQ